MKKAFVVGHPVGHSRSPIIHGHWLQRLGLEGSYERVEIAPAALAEFLPAIAEHGFVGGNVTLPHKEAAFRLVAEVTPRAARLQAVNTVWLEDGRLHGDNTDGIGFVGSLEAALGTGWLPRVRKAVVLGAGGAARAIAPALLDGGAGRVTLVNRSSERAAALAASLPSGSAGAAPWSELDRTLADADLLVNTTQLGMTGQPPLALRLDRLPDHAVVADIVYVPLETELLAAARARGLRTVDGLGMLLHQAVPGFSRWFGMTPQVTPELRALLVADLERAR
ncbi:MAG: shikimate dehydrogenase [Enterovirga sp.]|nr:shikimate dehydrogenase [Enterovirga sp.]